MWVEDQKKWESIFHRRYPGMSSVKHTPLLVSRLKTHIPPPVCALESASDQVMNNFIC